MTFVDAARADAEGSRESVLGDAHGDEVVFEENFTGGDGEFHRGIFIHRFQVSKIHAALGAPMVSLVSAGDGVFFTVVGGPTGTSARLLLPRHQGWDRAFVGGAEGFQRPLAGGVGGGDFEGWNGDHCS